MDANENPFDNGYNRYPDPRQAELKSLISRIKGIPVKNMFIGNGSDEAIDLCFRVFCEPAIDNVVSIAPTYGMYKVAADINNVQMREVPLGEDFSLPVRKLLVWPIRSAGLSQDFVERYQWLFGTPVWGTSSVFPWTA